MPIFYNHEMLKKLCDENNLVLKEDYFIVPVNVSKIIEGKCKTDNCVNDFSKKFRYLVKSGAYCPECTKNHGKLKVMETCMKKYGVKSAKQSKEVNEKAKKTCLEKYGVENPNQCKEIRDKIKKTCLEKYGVENPNQCKEVRDKHKKTCLEKYGVEYISQHPDFSEKVKKTNLERFGSTCSLHNAEMKEKCKKTWLEKYGVEHHLQSDSTKAKKKESYLKKYGVEHPSQSEEIKEQKKETCLKNFGVEFPTQSSEVMDKMKQKSLEKYGVEHPMQTNEIFEKNQKSAYKRKEYTFPSGRLEYIQGYENYALDDLLQKETIGEENIIVGCKNVPSIWFEDSLGKKHRHYVDIFIPTQNKCIEVKSTWTITKKIDFIFLKQEAAKKLGFQYEIWVYNGKHQLVEKHV
jgi:hypothetical protein